MPPSPTPSSEHALEEQKEKAVVDQTSESDQAEPIAVEEVEEEEEEEEEEEDNAGGDTEADEDATAAPEGDGDDQPSTATGALDFDLPRSILRRIVKARLSEVAAQELGQGKEFGVSKEALEALGEGAKVFISFITSTANDLCKGAKRQTISAEDVVNALSDSGFEELAAPLRAEVEAKRLAAKEAAADKKRDRAAAAAATESAEAAAATAAATGAN